MSFREELKVFWLCYMADLLFKLLPVSWSNSYSLLLCVHIFLIINPWANLLRLRRGLKQSLLLQETGDMGWGGGRIPERVLKGAAWLQEDESWPLGPPWSPWFWMLYPTLNFWDFLLCLEGLRIGRKMGKGKTLWDLGKSSKVGDCTSCPIFLSRCKLFLSSKVSCML